MKYIVNRHQITILQEGDGIRLINEKSQAEIEDAHDWNKAERIHFISRYVQWEHAGIVLGGLKKLWKVNGGTWDVRPYYGVGLGLVMSRTKVRPK